MPSDKRSPGASFKVPPAETWNNMVDAGNDFARRGLGDQSAPTSYPLSADKAKVLNDSGAAIAAGRVLEFGAKLLTTLKRDAFWFSGDTPTEDYKKIWGVALFQTPDGSIGDFQVAGLAVASVDIVHLEHTHVDVVDGSTQLESKWVGNARIVRPATGSTGVQDCVIQLGCPFFGPIQAVVTQAGGIDSNDNGDVEVWNEGSLSGSTEDAYYTWLYDDETLAEDQRIWIQYIRSMKRFEVLAPWCPAPT